MSDFKFNCPHCQQSLEAPPEIMGQIIPCPTCSGQIQLPALTPSLPESQPAKKRIVMHKNPTDASRSASQVSERQRLESLLDGVKGLFLGGVKDKVKEVIGQNEHVIHVVAASKIKTKDAGSKLTMGVFGGLKLEKDEKKDETIGLLVVTAQRVVHVSKILWQTSVDQMSLEQIESVDYETGLLFATLRILGRQNRNIEVSLDKKLAQPLADVINQAIADAKTTQQRASQSPAQEIERFAMLQRQGIISQQEYERAKAMIIGKPLSKVEEAIGMIESLHGLFKQGVLSESEFNLKKWDILSKP